MPYLNRVFLLILLFIAQPCFSQTSADSLGILFWNVENLFHPDNNPGPADEPFTPDGERRWTYYRYHLKISQLAKTLLAIRPWNPPDIVCLSEIENSQVLTDLVQHPLLRNTQYSYLHRDSPDHRGMDVAILFKKNMLFCYDTCWVKIKNSDNTQLPTREILSACFTRADDSLAIFMNHWTSKYGGALESESKRISEAGILLATIDSISYRDPKAVIVVGGDLNDTRSSQPVRMLEESTSLQYLTAKGDLRSYKYQGKWEDIDHVFIGGNSESRQFRLKVISSPYLLENDEKYTGEKPKRTYLGFRFNGGISDHLPLFLTFQSDSR